MSLILNGTDGLSDVDGTAATPAIRGTDTNTGIFFPAADTIAFSEGGTEAMRIDGSGFVGIGTNNPVSKLQIDSTVPNVSSNATFVGAMQINENIVTAQAVGGLEFKTSAFGAGYGWKVASIDSSGAQLTFNSRQNSATWSEKVRIDLDGNLLVGYTTGGGNVGSIGAVGNFVGRAGINGAISNRFVVNWTGSAQLWIDSTNVGTITLTSDYRTKRNIETQTTPALERVMALRPVTYQMADYGDLFKAGEEIKEGFIAHEVQEVIPSGAEGVKDDETQIQSLRMDAILAVAVKAIQELKATVDTQAARIAALEA